MKILFRQKFPAFTLVELLVILAILSIISSALFSVFLLHQKTQKENQAIIEITQNGRVIIERINREIRQAKRIINDLPEEKSSAINAIIFEDGHTDELYHYIHYFQENSEVKRRAIGYYFSGDPEQELQPYNAIPPTGQTLVEKILEPTITIGEWVDKLEFWGDKVVNLSLTLKKEDKTLLLETSIFGRNF